MYGLEKVNGKWEVFEVAGWLFDPLLHFTDFEVACQEADLRNCRGNPYVINY
jgi:hypothetical protein